MWVYSSVPQASRYVFEAVMHSSQHKKKNSGGGYISGGWICFHFSLANVKKGLMSKIIGDIDRQWDVCRTCS